MDAHAAANKLLVLVIVVLDVNTTKQALMMGYRSNKSWGTVDENKGNGGLFYGNGKQGRKRHNKPRQRTSSNNNSNDQETSNGKNNNQSNRCQNCRGYGHKAEECPTPSRKTKPTTDQGHQNVADGAQSTSSPSSWERGTLFSASSSTKQSPCDYIFLDSGASHHFTARREWLHSIERCSIKIELGNGEIIHCKERGLLPIWMFNGKEDLPYTIRNVYYSPKFSKNLLSVLELSEAGVDISFKQKRQQAVLTFKGNVVGFGSVRQNQRLYVLNGRYREADEDGYKHKDDDDDASDDENNFGHSFNTGDELSEQYDDKIDNDEGYLSGEEEEQDENSSTLLLAATCVPLDPTHPSQPLSPQHDNVEQNDTSSTLSSHKTIFYSDDILPKNTGEQEELTEQKDDGLTDNNAKLPLSSSLISPTSLILASSFVQQPISIGDHEQLNSRIKQPTMRTFFFLLLLSAILFLRWYIDFVFYLIAAFHNRNCDVDALMHQLRVRRRSNNNDDYFCSRTLRRWHDSREMKPNSSFPLQSRLRQSSFWPDAQTNSQEEEHQRVALSQQVANNISHDQLQLCGQGDASRTNFVTKTNQVQSSRS